MLKMIIINMRFVIALVLISIAASSAGNELTLWVLASEFSNKNDYSDEEINRFVLRYPNASIDIGNNSDASLQVLIKNREIIEKVEIFRNKFNSIHADQISFDIKVHFLSWHHTPLQKIVDEAIKQKVDIVQVGSTWIAPLAQQKIIKNVNALAKSIENNFINSALQSTRYGNPPMYYALPWSVDIRTWFYNSMLVEGLDLSDTFTLEEFGSLCRKFKEQHSSGKASLLGLPTSGDDYSTLHVAMAWVWGWGGQIIDSNGNVHLHDHNVINGLAHYFELFVNGCAPLKNKNGDFLRLVDIEKQFLNDHYGLIFIGPWIVDVMTDNQFKKFVNFGAIPGIESGTPNTFTGGSHFALIDSKRTPEEEKAALDFLSYLSRNSVRGVGLSPYKKHLVEMLNHSELNQFPIILLKQEFRSFPAIPDWGEVEKILVHHLTNVFVYIDKHSKISEKQLKLILRKELSVAQIAIEKIVAHPDKSNYWFVISFMFFIGLIVYFNRKNIAKRAMSESELFETFRSIKETLHRVKPFIGIGKDNFKYLSEKHGKDIKGILEKIEDIKKAKSCDLEDHVRFLKEIEPIINEYNELYQYNGGCPEECVHRIITFFDENIREKIDRMSNIVDAYYISAVELKKMLGRFSKIYASDCSIEEDIFSLNITEKDLETCIENLLANSKKAVSQIATPKITIRVSKEESNICISISDNGVPFPHEKIKDLMRYGTGLRDIEDILGRWEGCLFKTKDMSASNKPAMGIKLKHRQIGARYET